MAVGADGAVDEPRVARAQRVRAEAELVGEPGPEALEEDVGAVREPQQRLAPARVAQRERERALARVGGEEHRPLAVPERRPPGAAVVARVGPLDLDHVRAERRQDLRAVGAGDRRRHVEHAHPLQRRQAPRAPSSPFPLSARMQSCSSRSSTGSRAPTGATSRSSPSPCSTRSSLVVPSESMVIIAGRSPGRARGSTSSSSSSPPGRAPSPATTSPTGSASGPASAR